MADTKIPTQAELSELYERAGTFAETFYRANADLVGSVSRAAYHAARREGYDHSVAGHIEARVSGMEKAARVEQKRARNEWAEENRAAFMGSV